MFVVIYTLVWLAVLVATNLFSFAFGRCGRKLPIIDDGLPWVMHRSTIPTYEGSGAPFDSDASTATGDDRG